jgi:hypothetical protein
MSVPARCIAIGVLVFLYWVAAFTVAVMYARQYDGSPVDPWWAAGWLRKPGLGLGEAVYFLMEEIPGWDHAFIFGWPLYIALFITALGMGTGAWLLAALITGWWLRRKRS